MADAVEAAQALDVDVEQLARTIALISHRRRWRVELLKSTQTGSPAHSGSGGYADINSPRNLPDGEPLTAQLDAKVTTPASSSRNCIAP